MLLGAGIILWHRFYVTERALPYTFIFSKGTADKWKAFGGSWEITNGSMRNDSDERGSKLIAGSLAWKDYSIESDVQLLGLGDAGVLARVTDAEEGVDAYRGYYAGLRTMDNSLVLGRANHGWEEYPTHVLKAGVQPFHWYHLTLTVKGCYISATATVPNTGEHARIDISRPDCFSSGQIGLRSYSSGGAWQNVTVHPVSVSTSPNNVLWPALPAPDVSTPKRKILSGYITNTWAGTNIDDATTSAQPITSLRFESVVRPAIAVIRGLVILTTPELYVQDSTGGVAIESVDSPWLKIGDEVQVTGTVDPHGFSAVLRNAHVRLLWEAGATPPISVTANQAATGAFDAMFIQVDGFLKKKRTGSNGAMVLELQNGSQDFHALLNPGRGASHFRELVLGSTLRLRGVCAVDPRYTNSLIPFVLLVRSTEDVEVIAGPPWWSLTTLIPIGIGLVILMAGAYHLYVLAKHWRLRAVMEERGRLAHEIHDTLAQSFAGIGFQLQAIRNSMPPTAPILEQQVQLACDLVRHSHQEARRSIASLRPEWLESAGLLSALESCGKRMVQHGSIAVKTTSEGPASPIPLRIKDTLFRIGQEAIANSVRHAHATTIFIRIVQQRSEIKLIVEDDGVGFTPSADYSGFGLVGMHKRAESISARLNVQSSPGMGTYIGVAAPLPARVTFTSWLIRLWRQHRVNGGKHEDPYIYRG